MKRFLFGVVFGSVATINFVLKNKAVRDSLSSDVGERLTKYLYGDPTVIDVEVKGERNEESP